VELATAAAVGAVVLAAQAGNPQAGRAIFEGKGGCLQCHTVANRGGQLGPDLSDIGVFRQPLDLRLALTDPDADIAESYITLKIVTESGDEVTGVRIGEDDYSLQLRDTQENVRSFVKDKLKELGRELQSLMPSYDSRLSAAELDHLVAYLSSLKRPLAEPGVAVTRTRSIAPPSENLDWLTRPDRDSDELPEEVLDAMQIPAGGTVADVGAGAGYFTWRLAQRVGPSGKVIAVDIQKEMLELAGAELKKRGIENVELVLGQDRDPRLPEAAVDLVLLANTYHEFSEPEAMMAAIHRSLRPDGRLVMLEYRKEEYYAPVLGLHKMTLQEMRLEIEPLGFRLEQALDILPLQHFLIFSKQPVPAAPAASAQ
jgi:putative heme-binding domain-containing protein